MQNRIHIFGASGSGTSTLGRELANRMKCRFLDADSYYWIQTDPPFIEKRDPAKRIALIQRDIHGESSWVLSGSMCCWGDPLLHYLTLAVFLYLDPEIRMERIAYREAQRYGDRILPGGDMYGIHREFMAWAQSYDHAVAPIRSLYLHERWIAQLRCPVLRLDSAADVTTLCDSVLKHLSPTVDRSRPQSSPKQAT